MIDLSCFMTVFVIKYLDGLIIQDFYLEIAYMFKKIKSKINLYMIRKEKTVYWWKIRQKAKCSNPFVKQINKLKHRKMMIKHNALIPLTVQLLGMPNLPHGLNGIFISKDAVIGEGCTIFHQVTIGSNTLSDSGGKGSPTIGDNVYIGCGAKIIGNVHVGNNVRIGANCVVVEDVPDNCTVVLGKPRVIHKENKVDNKFISISDFDEMN